MGGPPKSPLPDQGKDRLPTFVPLGMLPGMPPVKISLPTRAASPPAGPDWLHEIKHDGFRMIARRDGERTRLISRRGLDCAASLPALPGIAGKAVIRPLFAGVSGYWATVPRPAAGAPQQGPRPYRPSERRTARTAGSPIASDEATAAFRAGVGGPPLIDDHFADFGA
jgi:hypothetical protein